MRDWPEHFKSVGKPLKDVKIAQQSVVLANFWQQHISFQFYFICISRKHHRTCEAKPEARPKQQIETFKIHLKSERRRPGSSSREQAAVLWDATSSGHLTGEPRRWAELPVILLYGWCLQPKRHMVRILIIQSQLPGLWWFAQFHHFNLKVSHNTGLF